MLLLGGFAIAPTLIGALSLTERTVPPARLTEGMAIMHTGLVAGVAPGATIGGVVIDAHGASAAYLVCVAAGVVAAMAAQALPRSRHRLARRDGVAELVGSGDRAPVAGRASRPTSPRSSPRSSGPGPSGRR